MPGMCRRCLPFLLLSLVFCWVDGLSVDAADKRPTVPTSGPANLRAGPGPNYPVITFVKGGTPLILESRQEEWYLVTAPTGQKGYVYGKLLQLKAAEPLQVITPPTIKVAPADDKAKEPVSIAVSSSPAPAPSSKITHAAARPTEQAPAQAKSPALIQLIEGRESDITLWLTIALGFFLIGWICGGNYYLRRDRLRRTKLRF